MRKALDVVDQPQTGWTAMPRPNYRLTALAEDVARRARPLLPTGSGMFLGLELCDSGILRMLWWRSDDFGLVAEIAAPTLGHNDNTIATAAATQYGAVEYTRVAAITPMFSA